MTSGLDDPTLSAAVRPSFASGPDDPRPADDLPADLHWFLDDGRPPAEREAPPRTLELATSLHARLAGSAGASDRHAATLAQRIVTDATLRAEADRDQNVYLGRLFTRAPVARPARPRLPARRPWPRSRRRCAGPGTRASR